MNCLNCGKHVENSASYCDYCGVGVVYLSSDVQSHSCQERVGPPGYMCFVLNNDIAEAPIFEATDENSQVLYKLGKYEPLPIIAENENWFEVLLPGELRGFISKVIGRKLEISHEKINNPLGYYRINTRIKIVNYVNQPFGSKYAVESNIKTVNVYSLPDLSSQQLAALQAWQCVPIIEDRKGWFKIQLDDGVRGFVPKEYGIRTLRKESLPLPPSPDGKSTASVLGGIATFVGLMVLGAALAGGKQGVEDIS